MKENVISYMLTVICYMLIDQIPGVSISTLIFLQKVYIDCWVLVPFFADFQSYNV